MTILRRHINAIYDYNALVAQRGCDLIDMLHQDLTPSRLQAVQDTIRAGLINARKRLTAMKERRGREEAAVLQSGQASEDKGRRRRELTRRLALKRTLLREQRVLLQQFGDACAWLVLGSNRRVLAALFDSSRTHDLPSGIGLIAPIQAMMNAHATGLFLVIENDLTRCLSFGDFTVVWASRAWSRPLLLELKATSVSEAGAGVIAEIDFLSPISSIAEDQELLKTFEERLGLKTREGERIHYTEAQASRERRQASELLERADRLVKVTTSQRSHVGVAETLWPHTKVVLERAQQTGAAFDLVEPGLVYVAWKQILRGENSYERNQQGFRRLITRIVDGGLLPRGAPVRWISSVDLVTSRNLSPMAPPIPLWPLPKVIRTELLSGTLVFGCLFSSEVWEKALAPFGITFEEKGKEWHFRRGEGTGVLAPITAHAISVGIALSGMSPRSFAASVHEFLTSQESARS